MKISANDRSAIFAAAAELELSANVLRDCHTIDGEWRGEAKAKAERDAAWAAGKTPMLTHQLAAAEVARVPFCVGQNRASPSGSMLSENLPSANRSTM